MLLPMPELTSCWDHLPYKPLWNMILRNLMGQETMRGIQGKQFLRLSLSGKFLVVLGLIKLASLLLARVEPFESCHGNALLDNTSRPNALIAATKAFFTPIPQTYPQLPVEHAPIMISQGIEPQLSGCKSKSQSFKH